MSRITKEQAVTIVGQAAVETLELMSVDFTGRLTDGSAHIGYTEFAASVTANDAAGKIVTATMYVFIDSDKLADCNDMSNLNWDLAIAEAEFEIV